jgi:hypothetical protein
MASAAVAVSTWPVNTTRSRACALAGDTAQTFWLRSAGTKDSSGLGRWLVCSRNATVVMSPSAAAASAPAGASGPRPNSQKMAVAPNINPSASA